MDSDGRCHILFASHGFRQQSSVGTDQSFAFDHETNTQNPKPSVGPRGGVNGGGARSG